MTRHNDAARARPFAAHRVRALAILGLSLAGCGSELEPRVIEVVDTPKEEAAEGSEARRNVLFLCVDDLRPELHCYGDENVISPNIDRLAGEGLRFDRAYCQVATCGPSRVALLTGLRPETSGAIKQWANYRELMPDLVALPELFKQNGWTTRAMGKVHHGLGDIDDTQSWSEPCWRPERWQRYYALPESHAAVAKAEETWTRKDGPPRVLAWEAPDVPASELPDGMIADEAIRFLREPGEQPFFLVVGFLKPHLPFVAPKKYWDLYPAEEVEFSSEPTFPTGAPDYASNESVELIGFQSIREAGIESESVQRELIRGYRACVSFVDAQVGRVLATLEEEGLRDSTIVVLWGDHGWHLGDQSLWGKHTNYERAMRTPLIVSAPGMKARGAASAALVESVDLYPSLADLCGLESPDNLEGLSFVPLLERPDAPWKRAVFGEYQRTHPAHGKVSGRTLRTDRYRLIEWTSDGFEEAGLELYDLRDGRSERANLASAPEHAELLSNLRDQLNLGWAAALPK